MKTVKHTLKDRAGLRIEQMIATLPYELTEALIVACPLNMHLSEVIISLKFVLRWSIFNLVFTVLQLLGHNHRLIPPVLEITVITGYKGQLLPDILH